MTNFRLIMICVLAAACRSEADSRSDTAAAATPSLPAPAAAAETEDDGAINTTGSSCPHNGRWSICTVERRLRQAGFVVKPAEGVPVKRAGFTVVPAVYTLGRARVEFFLYPDSTSLARDLAGIDTISVAPRGVVTPWETNPMLVRSGNLAAVLLSQNQRQAERFSLAITAGAPQRGSPR